MIRVHCRPLPESRTANSSAAWLAECEADGRRFEAKSRHGAANALARELVAAGIPDAPMEVRYEGLAGTMRYPSFHAAAGWTFSESASTPLRRVPFREFDLNQGEPLEGPGALHGHGQHRGGRNFDGSLEAPESVTPKSEAAHTDRECALPECGKRFRPWRPQSLFCSQACRQKAYRKRAAAEAA